MKTMKLILNTREAPITEADTQGLTESTFIRKGEGSQSAYHAWDMAYYLLSDPERKRFALEVNNYGDPDNAVWNEEEEMFEEEDPTTEVVALLTDPEVPDDDWIAWYLIDRYVAADGYFIDLVHEDGDIDLERGAELERERIRAAQRSRGNKP